MQPCPFFLRRRDSPLREVLVHERFPLCELLVPSIQAQVERKAGRPADIEAGDGIVGKRVGGITVVVVTIHVREQTAHMLAQGVIHDQRCCRFRAAVGFGLLQEVANAAVVDLGFLPRRFGQEAGEVGFVSAVEDAARNVGETLVGQDHQPGQVMLKMLELAAVLKQIAEGRRMGAHRWGRGDKWQLHQRLTCITSNCSCWEGTTSSSLCQNTTVE
jgi:hypothetical protein